MPLNRLLADLEQELSGVRMEFQETTHSLDRSTLDLSLLGSEIESLQDNSTYLSNLLGDYLRKLESRLHVAELHRYEELLEAAKLAPENAKLSQQEIYAAQLAMVSISLDRLNEALGGSKFEGRVAADCVLEPGSFVMLGPAVLFLADEGEAVGTAEQRLGSLEPTLIEFTDPEDSLAAKALVRQGVGLFPLDPSLGNAHELQSAKLGPLEEFEKGGVVMYAIAALAAAALLVALLKWLGMAFLRLPSRNRVQVLLEAVKQGDEELAAERVRRIKGPMGRMLTAGVKHMRESRELVEEVMYESVLTTRLRLQRFLPFVAVSAAAAPLLGLLGTVTGIIKTFQLITVFGSGDVKSLSGGISEALITTKYGLIVAIPSLLIHAFLSRKAKGVIGRMETEAVAFANEISRLREDRVKRWRTAQSPEADAPASPDPDLVRTQVKEILNDILGPLVAESAGSESLAQSGNAYPG
jgi:biopolymer transport protein ExbB